jgi:alanine dehydrogenase
MSPIYLSEGDVTELVDMECAIAALRSAFAEQANGGAINSPRTRARYWGSRLNMMSAGLKSGRFGFKAYAGTNAPTVYHVMLYDAERGLIAIIEARRLSRLRTGAATGLATDLLAKRGPVRLAMIGAGEQARTQLAAVAAVREMADISVFARNLERLRAFCADVSAATGQSLRPASSAAECIAQADVIITATDSETPVIHDAWLPANVHINTVGANAANRMELDLATFARARLVATDDIEQARIEAGEIIACVGSGTMAWSDIAQMSDLIDKDSPKGGLTIFKSLGAALEDVALASAVYDRAIAQGRGRAL